MKFEYRGPGAPKGIDAEIVAAELQEIYDDNGGITPESVVDRARPTDAVLHPVFEWRDSVAAEQYRQSQARQLVRAVVLVSDPNRRETAPVIRAFVSLHNPAGDTPQSRRYKPMLEVLGAQNEAERDEVLRRLRNELLNLRQRYIDLLAVSDILAAAQDALALPTI